MREGESAIRGLFVYTFIVAFNGFTIRKYVIHVTCNTNHMHSCKI